jgi:hypothetical protein
MEVPQILVLGEHFYIVLACTHLSYILYPFLPILSRPFSHWLGRELLTRWPRLETEASGSCAREHAAIRHAFRARLSPSLSFSFSVESRSILFWSILTILKKSVFWRCRMVQIYF